MEKQNIPLLRFPEFEGVWVKRKLGSITTKINSGKTPLGGERSYTNAGVLFIRSQNVIDDTLSVENPTFIPFEVNSIMKNSSVKPNDILLNITGASIGRSCVVPEEFQIANVNQHVCIIRLDESNEPHFVQPLLSSRKGQNLLLSLQTGSGREGLNFQSIKEVPLFYPTLTEQQKIASFFSAIDGKITQLKQKKILLEQYKKGVMQKIFSQTIRFKDDNGQEFPKWEKKKLGDIAERMVNKNNEGNTNVLTISAQNGLVSQLDFFNKSVSAKDVTGYYLLTKDDFAYNKSYSNGYPMGATKRLKLYDKGVVSTLYICFSFTKAVNLLYMEQYFESGTHNRQIEKVAQEGARNHGLLNIGVNDFFSTEILLPSLQEQTKIANFLSEIDNKINHLQKKIEKADVWKKGLMQQMFV